MTVCCSIPILEDYLVVLRPRAIKPIIPLGQTSFCSSMNSEWTSYVTLDIFPSVSLLATASGLLKTDHQVRGNRDDNPVH